jgi:hypothetical protein
MAGTSVHCLSHHPHILFLDRRLGVDKLQHIALVTCIALVSQCEFTVHDEFETMNYAAVCMVCSQLGGLGFYVSQALLR